MPQGKVLISGTLEAIPPLKSFQSLHGPSHSSNDNPPESSTPLPPLHKPLIESYRGLLGRHFERAWKFVTCL